MATKQFQNAKLNVTHLDLKDDASRSVLQSGENISHSLGKIARWYKDIIWTDSKATTEVFGIVKLSDDYKSESTETVPTSKTLNDVVKLIKQTGGWNTTYDFNSNIESDENLQNGQFKVTEHDLEGDIDHYVSIKGLGSAAYTESSAYATAGHTHLYAGSDSVGGPATSANKLNTDAGSTANPVYFKNGIPVACTHSLNSTVPSDAVFTDTTYTIESGDSNGQIKVTPSEGDPYNVSVKGLGSAAYTDSDEYAMADHTHKYAGSSSVGGVANSAAKLSDIPTAGIGSETKPVFFSGTTGRPVACTYSLNATVPANAIFTDEKVKQSPVTTDGSFEVLFAGSTGNTEKTEGVGKTTTLTFNPSTGALSATSFSGNGSGLTSLNATNISSGTLSVNRLPGSAVTIGTYGPAAGGTLSHSGTFDVPDFTVDAKGRVTGAHTRTFTLPAQYTHPTHTSKTSGLYKITVDNLGHVSGTAAVTKSDIPALDYISSTTTRNPNVVLAGPISGAAAAPTFRTLVANDLPSHTHTKSDITDFPTSLKNPNSLTVQGNGTASFTYDGSVAKTLNIKPGTGISVSSDTSGNITITNTSTNTDTKVTQTATTTNANYEVLFSGTADNTTRTEGARKNSNLTFNPSTGILQITATAYGAIEIYRKGSANGAAIRFYNDATTGTKTNLGSIGMKDVDGDIFRYLVDGTTMHKICDTKNTSFTASLTSGTKIGTIKIGGASTDLYCQTNTDTKVTAVGNHYTPSGGTTTSASGGTLTDITNSSSGIQVVTGVTKDAAGHVTGVTSKALKSVNTNTTYSFASGDSNGQIKVTPSSGTAYNVSVKGLGSAAYTASTKYVYKDNTSDTLSQFDGAPSYLLGIESFTNGGTVKWQSASSVSVGSATKASKLSTARTINGVKFDGTANIIVPRSIKHIHYANGTNGTSGYVKICTVGTNAAYGDQPIRITIGQRRISVYDIFIVFENSGSAKATIRDAYFRSNRSAKQTPEVHYYLNSNGYYDIYVKKTESQDHIFIMDYLKSDGDEGDHVELTWTNTIVSTLPSGSVAMSNEMARYYDSKISRTANTVLAAPNGSAGSATFRALVAADLPSASTSASGIVQLNNTVTSTSTTQAATANAVKTAYDYKHYIGSTSTDGTATAWSYLAIKEYDNAYPDGMTLKKYGYGGVITLSGGHSRLELYANHNSSTTAYNSNGIQFRTGWVDDKKPWRMLLDNVNYSSYITPAEIGASASDHSHPYLPLDGGTMTGNITFAGVSSTTYPALSNQIYFSGSTDWARILYEVTASDAGQLVFETGDDANAKIVFRNKVTSGGTYTRQVTIADGVISGNGSGLTSLNASNISSGTLSADRLATSGVTAGSYGPSANATPGYGATFNVPYITVDAKGRVTAISTKTVKIPASDNIDTKVTQSATSTANFRGVILGTNNTVYTGDTRETTVTGQGYITNKIFAQPSTGNLYASNIYAFVNGTDEVRIALYRSGNSSWRFLNSGGTLSLQNNYYNSAVQSWYNVAQFDYSGTNAIKFTTPPQRTGTNRSTTYGYGGISMAICSKNSWAMGMSWLNNARDTIRGEFGAYGTANNLTYYYWGTAHNATKLRLYPGTGGGLVSQQSNGFRIATNGYGVIFRVDSDNFYILLTDKKTDGSELTGDNWNSKRPLQIGLSSGVCNINGNAGSASKVYSTNTPGSSSHAGYSIPFFSGPIDSSSPEKNDTAASGNKTILHNGEFRLGLLEGTTSVDGYAQLILGNGIASGTAGNKYGKISLYSSSTYAVQIIPAKVTATRTLTLPNESGTVALTSHTHSYIPTSSAKTLFSGTAAASITMTSMSGYTRLVVFCKNTSNSSYFTVELQCTTGYHYHAMTVSPPPAAQTSNSFYGLLFNLSSNTKLSVSAGKYSNLSSSASLANGPTVHITKVIGYKF